MDVAAAPEVNKESSEKKEKAAGCIHYKRKSKFVVSNFSLIYVFFI